MISQLLALYLRLGAGIFLGWILGCYFGKNVPNLLGKFLFYCGVPIGIVAFLRQADLSGNIWLSPIMAWSAITLGALSAWLYLKFFIGNDSVKKTFQGSFLLTTMFGNTGYLGYPIILAMVGEKYFGWAVFYDLLGTTVGAYGLGALLGNHFTELGISSPDRKKISNLVVPIFANPPLWGLILGLGLRQFTFSPLVESSLHTIGWGVISLSLVLIGMRLSQLTSWRHVPVASASLGLKMLFVPLTLGLLISSLNVATQAQQVMILQMAMPPAFATLVISETYQLDYELTVTTVAAGSLGLLAILPFWLVLLGN